MTYRLPKAWLLFLTTLIIGVFVSLSASVSAQENTESPLSVRQQERITNLAANISNRMDATVVRLEQINKRVASRADKTENYDEVMANVKSNTEKVNASLQKAKRTLGQMDTNIASVVGSEKPKERWWQVRTFYLDAKDNLREAHELLSLSVLMLKEPAAYTVSLPTSPVATSSAASSTATSTTETNNSEI